jgi:predicted metal-dependent TIM-barrel fold hydrolase
MSTNSMMFIDPHIHMVSRTTYDYLVMREHGVVAVIEPSFWLGQPRTSAGTFKDYFSGLVGWERFRASQFGIQHYCTIGLNPKEAITKHWQKKLWNYCRFMLVKRELSLLANWL